MKMGVNSVLLKRLQEEGERKTASGIIIPSTVNQAKVSGRVIAVGRGTTKSPMEIKVNDVIKYESLSAFEIEIDGIKLDLIDKSACLFIE